MSIIQRIADEEYRMFAAKPIRFTHADVTTRVVDRAALQWPAVPDFVLFDEARLAVGLACAFYPGRWESPLDRLGAILVIGDCRDGVHIRACSATRDDWTAWYEQRRRPA